MYGSRLPKIIDQKNIKNVPIVLYAGTKDKMVDLTDARWIRDNFETVVEFNELNFGHSDYMFVNEQEFYDSLLAKIEKYNKNWT